MSVDNAVRAAPARVIVIGNEKGGSGKSTVAMHAAIAFAKAGQRVATIDLDTRQRSLTRYIENRRAWARQLERRLDPRTFQFRNRQLSNRIGRSGGLQDVEGNGRDGGQAVWRRRHRYARP
jgi:cellulose biosynthesis protein BcsQ